MTTPVTIPDAPLSPVMFEAALLQATARAKAAYPAERCRIERGLQICLSDDVVIGADGVAIVHSQSEPDLDYHVGSQCSCPDAKERAPEGRCKHRWARSLFLYAQQHASTVELLPHEEDLAEASPSTGIDPRFLTSLHGKPFVRYQGLLSLAHERGLVSLKARFISVTPDLALAEAEAVFADGRTFCEASDATPGNVGAQVRPHFARMALVRAKARALRDALNINLCSFEEVDHG
jgi:hypothetical protein